MEAETVRRIEAAVDAAASATFAAAVGGAAYALLKGQASAPALLAEPAIAAVAALLLGYGLLRLVQPRIESAPVPIFDVRQIEPMAVTAAEEPLLLDDILAELGPDSRVVRLFDRAAMPSPGELKERIDRHLDAGTAFTGDASQALHDALAELRRSLR